MRIINVNEQKKILLEILVDFDKVCEQNNIKYSLAYGTLLGAVRHKGFIPWDDDVDVFIHREDFNRLLAICDKQLARNHKLICTRNNKRFSAPLPKIIDTDTLLIQNGHNSDKIELGVYIDIFVLDWIPENKKKRAQVIKKSITLQKAWSFCGNNFKKQSAFVNLLRGALNMTPLARLIAIYLDKWAAKHCYEKTTISSLLFGYEESVMTFLDFCDLTDYEFEGYTFKGISKSDHYLTQWYGDYMTLPPEHERISNHDMDVFMKDA